MLYLSRSSVYCVPRPVSSGDLALMRRDDELHLDYPFAAPACCASCWVEKGALLVGACLHLDEAYGIEAIYRRPDTSKPARGHKIYPCLLRKLAAARPNQVWAMDITYIPMARAFVYLAAVMAWFSRRLLARRLSMSMDGRGAWRDNVFVERLCQPIKYEEVHLRACDTVTDARTSIGKYLAFHDGRRPHSSLTV